LSPRVGLSHSVDPSISEYVVQNRYSNDEFQLFLTLGSGSTIRVTQANLEFFLSLSREFGNSTLYISLMEHFDNDVICSQIQDSTPVDLHSEGLIGRISSNFCGLTWSELDVIPVSVFFHILSHDFLIVSSEDDLFSYINSRICSDPEYLDLLQFVRFEYLSANSICCLLSAFPDSIDGWVWEPIWRRLIRRLEVEFPLQEAKSVDGIISYLSGKYGGQRTLTLSSKSVPGDKFMYSRPNVVVLTQNLYFCSSHEPGQWVCWDFHEIRLRPTHYTITSDTMKSWVIESSLDGEVWTEIDRKTDNEDFKRDWATASLLFRSQLIALSSG
jgi:hypothetical protein